MSESSETPNFRALDALLEAERAALLKGDLVALTEMLPAKETLIEALNASGAAHVPQLAQLDSKVRRNQALLDGALEGIRDVAARMAALRRMRGSLETYGSDGRKRHIEIGGEHALEKRA